MAEIAVAVAVGIAVLGVLGCTLTAAATRLRIRRRAAVPDTFDAAEVSGAGEAEYVLFTTPYCVPCRRIKANLDAAGAGFVVVDLSEYPRLARTYDVRTTPTLFALDAGGAIRERLVNAEAESVAAEVNVSRQVNR